MKATTFSAVILTLTLASVNSQMQYAPAQGQVQYAPAQQQMQAQPVQYVQQAPQQQQQMQAQPVQYVQQAPQQQQMQGQPQQVQYVQPAQQQQQQAPPQQQVQYAPAPQQQATQAAPAQQQQQQPAAAAAQSGDDDPAAREVNNELPSPANEPERDVFEYETNGSGKILVVDYQMVNGKKQPSQVRDCHIKGGHIQHSTCRAEPTLLAHAQQNYAATGNVGDLVAKHKSNKGIDLAQAKAEPVRMLAKRLK